MARLLTPQAFGVVALATAAIEFLQVFLNQGLNSAIVQRKEVDRRHLDSAFWAMQLFGLLLLAALVVLAEDMSTMFGEPEMAGVLRALSPLFVLAGLSSVQDALLRRHLRFKALAIRDTVGQLGGGVVGIAMAISELGVWSLVGMHLTARAIAAVLLWRASRWRPQFRFSKQHYSDLVSFGANMTGVQVLSFLRNRADVILIGGALGTTSLGFYSLARQLVIGTTAIFSGTTLSVAASAFARLQSAHARLARALEQTTSLTAFAVTPAFMGLFAVAANAIPILYGPVWLPAVPVAQAMAVGGLVTAFSSLNMTAITALGRVGWRLALDAALAGATIAAIAIALPWGLTTVAWSATIGILAIFPIQLTVTLRLTPVRLSRYLRSVMFPLFAAGLMTASVIWLSSHSQSAPWLLVSIALGVLIYLLLMLVVAPGTLREVYVTLRSALRPNPH